MNNFELHELATQLSDTETGYGLARKLVRATELLDSFDRYQNLNVEYKQSPFCNEVRDWLKENLTNIIPYSDFTIFEDGVEL